MSFFFPASQKKQGFTLIELFGSYCDNCNINRFAFACSAKSKASSILGPVQK